MMNPASSAALPGSATLQGPLATPGGHTTAPVSETVDDLFVLGRAAQQAARHANGGRVVFTRARQLLQSGAWRGPRDAALTYIEEADVAAAGGLPAARDAGARMLVATSPELARQAAALGMDCLWRVRYRASNSTLARRHALEHLAAVLATGQVIQGVMPTPDGEPLGLDTLRFFAECRLRFTSIPHVVADFALLGHRLAQMSLAFGADELHGPIVAERALRLGANAGNPALTRKEAALLVRAAGLNPCERLSGGVLEDCAP